MTPTDNTLPVSQLITLGDVRKKDMLDYLALGLGPDAIETLLKVLPTVS